MGGNVRQPRIKVNREYAQLQVLNLRYRRSSAGTGRPLASSQVGLNSEER